MIKISNMGNVCQNYWIIDLRKTSDCSPSLFLMRKYLLSPTEGLLCVYW